MFGMELKLQRRPTKTGKVLYNVQIKFKGQCISLILVGVNYWKVLKMVRETWEEFSDSKQGHYGSLWITVFIINVLAC